MSTKTQGQKLARAIQKVSTEELGEPAPFNICLEIALAHDRKIGRSRDEEASAAFKTNRERLQTAINMRAARAPK